MARARIIIELEIEERNEGDALQGVDNFLDGAFQTAFDRYMDHTDHEHLELCSIVVSQAAIETEVAAGNDGRVHP